MILLSGNQQTIFIVAMGALAIILFGLALGQLWKLYGDVRSQRTRQRLQDMDVPANAWPAAWLKPGTLDRGAAEAKPSDFVGRLFDRLGSRLFGHRSFELLAAQAGVRWRPSQWLAGSLLLGVLGFAMGTWLEWGLGIRWAFAMAAALAPTVYGWQQRRRRFQRLTEQLPELLHFLSRALRAGHALVSALHLAARELREPIATELRLVHDELHFGVSMQTAFEHLRRRVPLPDIQYFVVAVLIQRDAGGDLAEVLAKLANLISERLRFQGRVQVLSTEGRLSVWLLCGLPFALAALLEVVNHEFVATLWTDPAGIRMTQILLVMMAIGVVWSMRIVKIRV